VSETIMPMDRRRARHDSSVDEVVAVALEVMAETGAAGMSLGEVARRMGVKPPSLYVYFPSKAALCDEVFARGWRTASTLFDPYDEVLAARPDPRAFLVDAARAFVSWAVDHPAYAQLMFWRPVPAWSPSAAAYEPAQALYARTTAMLRTLRNQGGLRRGADLDEATGVWTVLIAGLVSQQLANQPGVAAHDGRFTRLVAPMVAGFLATYGATRSTQRHTQPRQARQPRQPRQPRTRRT
jgi:AcrR family transcriptional regulator